MGKTFNLDDPEPLILPAILAPLIQESNKIHTFRRLSASKVFFKVIKSFMC